MKFLLLLGSPILIILLFVMSILILTTELEVSIN